jgi:hypothetical protein
VYLNVGGALRVLLHHQVDFLVVGGVNALLLGAPAVTFDLDIVPDRSPENVERLLAALASMEARYRSRPELRPAASHLLRPDHQLLMTRFGALDVLGRIGEAHSYADLLPSAIWVEIEPSLSVPMLSAAGLLAEKKAMNRQKDANAISWLQAIVDRQP